MLAWAGESGHSCSSVGSSTHSGLTFLEMAESPPQPSRAQDASPPIVAALDLDAEQPNAADKI